jgi:ketosteroid isomerase-like protein
MLLALLLAADAPQTAAEAEHAFYRAAQTEGQWTAFRRFAAEDALMFTPQPVKTHELLADAKDPPIAVQWWAAESFVSCDGTMAVNTGPWVRPKASGYFTTVWRREPDGEWKWRLDHGDALAAPRPAGDKPRTERASCRGKPDALPVEKAESGMIGAGTSPDGTLHYQWYVAPDGERAFNAWLWNGEEMVPVVDDRVAAPPAAK